MNVLAFDTCLGAVSVAVSGGGAEVRDVLAHAKEVRATGHAERLMPMIAEVMEQSGLAFANLQRLAVTIGPGTFTGVRTAIAAARALRLATGLEVVGMTSLATLAAGIDRTSGVRSCRRPLMIAVDARRGGLYVQAFGVSALEPLSEPRDVTPEDALAVAAGAGYLMLAGSGARTIAEAAARARRSVEIVAGDVEPDARDLALLAARLTPLSSIAPMYLRPPDAKPQGPSNLRRTL